MANTSLISNDTAMSTNHVLEGPEENSWIPCQSLGKLFLETFKSFEESSLALIDVTSEECYTYGDLINFSENLSTNLRKLGVVKDTIIGIVAENSHRFCVALLASLYLAAPVHLINPAYTEYELKHVLCLTKPKFLFCSKKSLNNLMKIKNHFDIQTLILFEEDDDGTEGLILYKNLIRRSEAPFLIEEDIDIKTQTAIIFNSSGTTGLPKGVMLTHENLRQHFVYNRDIFHMKPADITLMVTPLCHMYAIHVLDVVLYSGSTVVLLDRFVPQQFLENIQKYQVEQLFLVPSLINFLANTPLTEEYDLSSVRYICSAGAAVLDEDCTSVKAKFKLKSLHIVYGLTEAGGVAISTPIDQPYPKGSCGQLVMGFRLKIDDRETHQKLKTSEIGEVCIKGPSVTKGYINNVEKTNEMFDSEGFLRTGDLGYFDEQGFVYVIGRIKDMISYKAFQVSPVEIENVLLTHPSVIDVAVVGKPDRRTGEVAVGFVVRKEGASVSEEEISEYLSKFVCAEKRLHGGVRFVEAIPKNGIGKTLRNQLLQLLDNDCGIERQ